MTTTTLLIVEDDGILAANIAAVITELGYGVLGPVSTGEEAIALLDEQAVDLVLMDIELAGALNGIETAAIITGKSDLPIVFLTGFSQDALLERAKIVAPYGYLIKPVPERELAATVAMSLHRHALDRQLRESRLALAQSEARYRHLFEDSPLGIFRTTMDFRYLLVNAKMAQMVGSTSPEAALQMDPDKRLEFFDLLRTQGEVQNFEYQRRRKNGDCLWISMNACLNAKGSLTEEEGPVIDGFALDITTRKKAEAALEESLERHRHYLQTTPYGVFAVDQQGRYLQVNPSACRITGYSENELLALSIPDLLFPEDRKAGWNHFQTVLREGTGQDELAFRTKAGERRWWAITAVKANDDRYLGFCHDITEQRRAESALHKEVEERRLLLDNIQTQVWYLTDEYTYGAVNRAHANFTGLSVGRMAFHTIAEIFPPDVAAAYHQGNTSVFSSGKPLHTQEWLPHASGERRLLSILKSPVTDIDGKVQYVVCSAEDITERKRAEEEKRQLQTQLLHAQKLEAIGTLAGGIAHDFNNILAAVIGYADMAKEEVQEGTSLARDLDQVLKAGHRAKDLVKQILAFSRQAEHEPVSFYPAAVVKEAIKLLRPTLPATIAISTDLDEQAGPVRIDPTQMHQVLINLCTNAFHAMEDQCGELDIRLRRVELNAANVAARPKARPGPYIELAISDTGPGIPPEALDRIFDPFFTTKELGKGTGMGLSIVHGIIKSCEGFVTVDSIPGQGSTFHVFLPIAAEDQPAPASTEDLLPLGSEHILFIDDEEVLTSMAKTMLERLGYLVTVRTSSLEALNTFQNQPDRFDLVITDQTMPGMAGLDLSRRLLQIRPDLPIILCTGFSALVSEEKVRAMGIRALAFKPLTKKDIATLIWKVLGKDQS